MTTTTIKEIALTALLASLGCGAVFAQQIAPAESGQVVVPYREVNAPDAEGIIFSNLDSTPGDRYNSDPFDAFTVAGKSANGVIGTWIAIAFIPKVDVRAKELSAAIGYISGTKMVNLGIYSDNGSGTVGELLPGAQGSTTQIPDIGTCCQMAKVTLPGAGVALTRGTKYWLVASPDDVNAPTFSGGWHMSNLSAYSSLAPPSPWHDFAGQWPAGEVRGTKAQSFGPDELTRNAVPSAHSSVPAANVTIFTNLGPTSTDRYGAGSGFLVTGSSVPLEAEQWEAVAFTAKANSHATTLAAAIGYVSGTKKVNLGIYSDNGGTVGTLLPGGEGSTTEIPDSGECCELAQVSLPGIGVALTAGTRYWLVASPDDINAPSFQGSWQLSNLAVSAYQQPYYPYFINWTSFWGDWLAAEIRGITP